ncbi:MAG TPA: PP2C family protein-serine/threonine phosphatase [Thermoanaerobaculia bacterium]
MSIPASIEDLARLSDDAAVRARFGAHNRLFLPLVLAVMCLATIIETFIGIHAASPLRIGNATLNFLLVVFGLVVMRDIHRSDRVKPIAAARFVERHTAGTVTCYLALQYLLLVLFSGRNWMPWALLFPFGVLGFRLLTTELLLLHGYFSAVVIVEFVVGNMPKREGRAVVIATVVINAIVCLVAWLASRRLRREVVTDFTERRLHAREQIRMRDELRYARELQLSMLPEAAPSLDWLDVAGTSIPATEVGGDYYDYFAVGDAIALVSGDVAGHGMGSGIVLSALRSGFTLLRDQLHQPAAVMTRLHELVAQASRRRMLATASVLLIDPHSRRATLANAGHPPLLVRRDGRVEMIELFSPPLGVRLPTIIPQRELDVRAGDLFVLHTDGIYETRNEHGDTYGFDRLSRVIATHDGSAQALCDAILVDVDAFRGDAAQDDDITLVVAQMR